MPPAEPYDLPPPKDLSHLLSQVTRSRKASSIKSFYKYFSIPGIGQLAGGLPNSDYFPFDTLEAASAFPNRWHPTPTKPVNPPSGLASLTPDAKKPPSASRIIVPKDDGTVDRDHKLDLVTALQYGTAEGYPPLRGFIRDFTRNHMHPDHQYAGGPEVILTCGSTDGFSKTIQAFNDDWVSGRDPVATRSGLLCEEFAYMNAIQAARPLGMNIVPVAMDDEGMRAFGKGGLKDVLDNWDFSKGRRPHIMYTVTMGQNPASGVLSLERRKDIYKLCSEADIIIVEDDPYWFLQYPSAIPEKASPDATKPTTRKSSGYPFLDSLVPSYVSIDRDGRVVRLDTFSKTVAPGCRLGWITAQPALIERIQRITETTTQQPSGFVQSLIAELLIGPPSNASASTADGPAPGRGGGPNGTGYGISGWVRWLAGLRGNYERRMQTMSQILDDGVQSVGAYDTSYLPHRDDDAADADWTLVTAKPMYRFAWPMGGMFLWLEVLIDNHPLAGKMSGETLVHALWLLLTTKPYRVLVSPGTIFGATDEIREQYAWRYFRICFAACDGADVEPLSKRIVSGFKAFWEIRSVREVKKILEDDETGNMDVEGLGMLTGFC